MASTWLYSDFEAANISKVNSRELGPLCHYCKTNIVSKAHPDNDFGRDDTMIGICEGCGWWIIRNDHMGHDGEDDTHVICGAQGVLKQLDSTDLSLPLEELLPYLKANYDERLRLHPKRYEDVVAAVFKNGGHRVLTTSYSKDGGIDLFVFESDSTSCTGVQVKRYKNKIGVEQIRSFAGALMVNDLTKGVFVTTSEYTAGSKVEAKVLSSRGLPIELVDSSQFYDKLKLIRNANEEIDHIKVYERFREHHEYLPTITEFTVSFN